MAPRMSLRMASERGRTRFSFALKKIAHSVAPPIMVKDRREARALLQEKRTGQKPGGAFEPASKERAHACGGNFVRGRTFTMTTTTKRLSINRI